VKDRQCVVAVGQVVKDGFYIFAFGQIAVGLVAFGQLSIGVISMGQASIGVVFTLVRWKFSWVASHADPFGLVVCTSLYDRRCTIT
jgi:hypothetical protein